MIAELPRLAAIQALAAWDFLHGAAGSSGG